MKLNKIHPRNIIKNKWTRTIILATLFILFKQHLQDKVNEHHQQLDFARNVDEMHTRQLLDYVVTVWEFDSKFGRKAHQVSWLHLLWEQHSLKNAFLWSKNYPSVESKKKAVERLREEADWPILVHSDFEWGYVHSFDVITAKDIVHFWIPKEIIDFRNEENESGWGISAFPSAEFLWKKYQNIVLRWTHEQRLEFILLMQRYWKSIRNMMEYIGVDIVYWPDVDIVSSFDWHGSKNYIAQHDRSFGESFIIWQDLISAFINGYQSSEAKTLLVPKHFVWVGKSDNPHEKTDLSAMVRDDWSVAVFRNIINGTNPFLRTWYIEICLNAAKNTKWNTKYKSLLERNLQFCVFLDSHWIDLYKWDHVSGVMTSHVSWN